ENFEPFAAAKLQGKSGSNSFGEVIFAKTPSGLTIHINADRLAPGTHGLQIHEYGNCSDPDANRAGAHFNPFHSRHGSPGSPSHHLGDLGNVFVDNRGKVREEMTLLNTDPIVSRDWDQIIGRAIVIHEHADDFSDSPTGNSGKRVACGVIEPFIATN